MPAFASLKAPRWFAAFGALALILIAQAKPVMAENGPTGPTLSVTLDQAKISRVPEGTKTLVIGSPIVADVTLLKGSNTMVVTGKGYGETNLIALDSSGNVLEEKMIRVEPAGSVLVVQRGMQRESYSCAPKCMPSVELGDGSDQFGATSGQITQRNTLAQPNAQAQPGH
jgi:Flp pilus assembly secretin CpaC